MKVFDNLYFFGQSEYSAWALTTPEGIILFDTLFDYSVEDEVVNGMKKLGLNPADIKYAVVSHAHPDHDGGALGQQRQVDLRPVPIGMVRQDDVRTRLLHDRAEPLIRPDIVPGVWPGVM